MKILIADDAKMHRDLFLETIRLVGQSKGFSPEVLGEAENGLQLCELFQKFSGGGVDLVFCDIRMPVMDGLSALVKIKSINASQKIIMVSSEDLKRMQSVNAAMGETEKAQSEEAKKMDLLTKVAERIKAGVTEEGKINSILEGCEKLAADPFLVAQFFKATGYLKKPYDAGKLEKVIDQIGNSEFVLVE